MNVAIVRDGLVDNVIVVDSLDVLAAPVFSDLMTGATAVEVTAETLAGPGWTYDPDASPQFSPPTTDPQTD